MQELTLLTKRPTMALIIFPSPLLMSLNPVSLGLRASTVSRPRPRGGGVENAGEADPLKIGMAGVGIGFIVIRES